MLSVTCKYFSTTMILLLLINAPVHAADDSLPFGMRYYGDIKMLRANNLSGTVDLENALAGQHTYAVGIIDNAEGEITVFDDDILINYGKSGLSTTISQIQKGEKAMLLYTARVEKWQKTALPKNMTEAELYVFIIEQARKSGLNTKTPFPFQVSGNIRDLVWNVLDGTDTKLTKKGKQLFLRKLVGYKKDSSATLVGFYLAEPRSDFSHPGEIWHIHAVFKDEKTTGHANTFTILKGATLELPVK